MITSKTVGMTFHFAACGKPFPHRISAVRHMARCLRCKHGERLEFADPFLTGISTGFLEPQFVADRVFGGEK